MVNRKFKKKTLKKKSKNKTKKKYMNRKDIENLFMVSSFQKGGVDLHGGGVGERQSEHKPPAWLPGGPKPNPSGMKFQGFVKQNPSEPHPTSATSSQSLSSIGSEQSSEPILHQVTGTDDVPGEQINFDPSKDIENDNCKTLLQELRIILENMINEFNSL